MSTGTKGPGARGKALASAAVLVVGPTLCFLGVRSIAGSSSPSAAQAGQVGEIPRVADLTSAAPTPAQRELAAASSDALSRPFGPSPISAPVVPPTPEPIAAQTTEPQTPDKFVLTAIIGGRETMAVVNGRPRRMGDSLPNGWRVESIDASADSVTLAAPGKKNVVLKLRSAIKGSESNR